MIATSHYYRSGQSISPDNFSRDLLGDGTFHRNITERSVTGLTSNPTICEQVLKKSATNDHAVAGNLAAGRSGEDLFFDLARAKS